MVRKKNALPEIGEIVMATVVEVNPSHVYMILDDYKGTGKDGINREGFNINEAIRDNAIAYMHVSEIANYWIKNIREHIKEGQKHVVKVLKMDKGMVWVSKRRVSGQEAKQKLQEWKRSNKAEGLLRLLGEKFGVSLDEIYEKMGFSLDDAYGGDLWSAFEDIREQGIAAVMDLDFVSQVDEAWLKELEHIVQQNVEIPSVKIVGEFDLTSYEPNGVEIIKEALLSGDAVKGPKEVSAKLMFQVIAPPRYRVEVDAPDYQTAESLLKKVETKILKVIKKGGTGTFQRNK
ncbi:MAG TPA: translation initiation factor IF-2 subunit alpha [Candidatus Lokiarchaeia archaeon]|nr:translation initiation factor IF-2 subunit alpha [Candidatus Lokiarchaeia archaeon]